MTRAGIGPILPRPVTGALLLWLAQPALVQAQAATSSGAFTQELPGSEVAFEMILLPSGSFALGSPTEELGRDEDEGPQQQVSVSSFWMASTEVTFELFGVFRDGSIDSQGPTELPSRTGADGVTRPSPPYEDPSHGMGREGLPATGMTRLSALHFSRWLSERTGRLYRLPTEAEWEYACRATEAGPWGGGGAEGAIGEVAWFEENSDGAFHAVGTKAPNAWGLYDLQGNVAEWTLDPYAVDFYSSLPGDGSSLDPTNGPSVRGRGVVRGGAFDDEPGALRCADRFEETTQWKRRDPQIPKSRWWNTDSPHVGFRVVSPEADYTLEEIRAYWDSVLGAG